MKRVAAALIGLMALILTACGGGGGGGSSSEVPTSTPVVPVVTPTANVAVTSITAQRSIADAAAVITTKSGNTVAYYTSAGTKDPYQAWMKTKAGQNIAVYYGTDGSLQKVVDQVTGNYMIVTPRKDGAGTDFFMYSASGAFQDGYGIYKSGSTWYWARIVGAIGQITGNLSGTVTGSFALAPDSVAYGTPTQLDANSAAILDGTATVARGFGSRVIDYLVPSAFAQTVATVDKANLYSAVALSVLGGVVLSAAAGATVPIAVGYLLLGGAAVQAYRGITGIVNRNLDSIDQSINSAIEGNATNDLDSGIDPIASMQNLATSIVSKGIGSIKAAVVATIDTLTSALPDATVIQAQADTTAAPEPLPEALGGNSQMSGTVVDSTNKIYPATGTVDGAGDFTATGTASDGTQIQVTGNANTTSGSATGTYVRKTSSGATTATGSITSGKVGSVGKCQSTTQSGGFGTYSYAYNLGKSQGSFSLSYDMYSIPDAMNVVLGGKVLYTTGGLVSGGQSGSLAYSGSDTVFVNISAPDQSTAWTFTVGCGV
ncbi:MAG: hypothetical protein IH604_15575 [Burkholderiales bacterium]|nr:hypothetical protein [Burkholderiales bacterium]